MVSLAQTVKAVLLICALLISFAKESVSSYGWPSDDSDSKRRNTVATTSSSTNTEGSHME